MSGRIFVAVDLETTGLEPNRDAIIEVGAVRFQGEQILERFVSFVNPRRAIPSRIQQITGIRDSDVANAPPFEALAPELRAFVSSDVAGVVAHNAGFDLGFLRAQGLNFHRPTLDTLEMATIVLPGQASYSLGELCLHFGIPLVGAHRALADAEAAAALFAQLTQRLEQLPTRTLELLVASAGETEWPPLLLFSDALRSAQNRGANGARKLWPPARPHAAPVEPAVPAEPEPEPERTPEGAPQPATLVADSLLRDDGALPATLDPDAVAAYFAPGGPIARTYGDGYEPRPGQIEMARRVADALQRGDYLMVEAGTGTGKSLAYLLPAARWAVSNQRRVVIATHTIPLQEQLLQLEIPRVGALLHAEGSELRAAVLKGRANYLCRRRLHLWRTSHRLSAAELSSLARILAWLPTTRTGDVSELALTTPTDREVWQQICSDGATCGAERCGPAASTEQQDYYLLARRRAEHAHLLVVNHALLLADIAAEGRVLPPYSHLVVDEAHQLEGAATDQLTYRIEYGWITALVRRLVAAGDLNQSLEQALLFGALAELQRDLRRQAAIATEMMAGTRQVHEHLLAFALQMENDVDAGYAQRLPLDGRVRSQPGWGEVEIVWERCEGLLRDLLHSAHDLVTALTAARWGDGEPNAALLADYTGVVQRLDELLDRSGRIVYAPGGVQHTGTVCWIEVNDARTQVAVAEAPLHVFDLVQRELVHHRRSTIFTGATLRSGASFRFLRDRLGLWDVPAALVESPFDYKKSTLLFMPSDLVQPNQPGWQSALERAIIDAAEACSGRTLALFTSNSHLRATAEAVRHPLERLGITVLQQGVGSRQRILRDFRTQPRALLMGTRTFWEGVDLPGDELRCLILCKLPFAVPNDPLVAARSGEFDEPFNEYMLPDAVLRFRQGFGRLIRRATDRGVVLLLDARVWRKEYGQVFLDALPPCTVKHAPLSVLAGEVRKWLQR